MESRRVIEARSGLEGDQQAFNWNQTTESTL